MWQRLWTLFVVLACVSGEYLMGGHLDNNAGIKLRSVEKNDNSSALERKRHVDDLDLDLEAEESTVGAAAVASSTSIDNDVPRYHIPYPFAFNGGKPFSLEKDPITGKIDFEKAPPVRALNYTSRYHEHENKESENADGDEETYMEQEKIKSNNGDTDEEDDDVSPNEINTYRVNFHDFLNLPINYSSDKYDNDKYPLISSSYANTKVQSGANSYNTYNHRPYHLEGDAHPMRNPYVSMVKTSTRKTTIASDLKAKSTTIAYPSRIALSTTKAPAVTTWKPPTTPSALHSINRNMTEETNVKNVPSTEQLHTFPNHVEAYKSPTNLPAQFLNGETMEKTQTVTRYKTQPTLNNFVLSHAEAKPSAQHEDYKDSYDIYESLGDEGEGEGGEADGEDDGYSEESDYTLPLRDSSNRHVTSTTPATITVGEATASTASTTTTHVATTALFEGTTSAVTTVAPSASSTQSMFHDVVASNSLQPSSIVSQHAAASSSLNSDPGQSITERYDPMIIDHEYKSPIKSEQNRIGTGIVVESTSNIVIPPDKDTVSFVLGNRQNVEGSYYSIGTAIGENPYGSLADVETSFWPLRNKPHDLAKEPEHHPSASAVEPDRVVQKWWSSGSSALRINNELEPPRPQSSTFASVAQTTDAKIRGDDPSYVTFPDVETKNKDATVEEHVVNEADDDTREIIPPRVTATTGMLMTTNKTRTSLSVANNASGDLPQLAESLMPPAESSRPPSYYYHYQHDHTLRTDHARLPQRPLPPRIKPGFPGPPLDAGLRRRPYSPDAKLPNILPQFRPNAKASHGHRLGSDVIGTMPAGQSSSTRVRQPSHPSSRRPFPPPPSYLQRLNPPPPPIHAVRLAYVPPASKVDNASPHETEPTIRKFRPPHVSSISRGGAEENAPPSKPFVTTSDNESKDRGKSEAADERENESSEKYPEEPPMTPPRPPLFPKRKTADPLHVTTLQMIQHHGELMNDDDENEAGQPVEPVLAHQAERRQSDNYDSPEAAEQPVYVVYPVNTAVNIHPDDSEEKDDDGSVVVGTRGPHRPLPPDTLLQDEREKIHTVYNGRPVALDFPYPLEHPDPSLSMFPVAGTKETPLLVPSEQRQQIAPVVENEKNEQDAVNVIPYLQDFLPFSKKNDATISVTLHRTAPILTSESVTASSSSMSTSTPIAYVYTPTHAAAYPARHHHVDDDTDSAANVDDATATVLLPSQQPSSSSSSAPAPQNFMAPFVASISAEAPSKNSWSVVVVEQQPSEADKKMDGGNDDAKLVNSEVDTRTERNHFDVDNFKPQLFGGFKPLFKFPTEDMKRRDDVQTGTSRHSKELTVPDDRER